MKKLEKKIKKRYLIFMLILGIIIISGVVIVSHIISLQKSDIQNINLAREQSLLSSHMLSQVRFIEDKKNTPVTHHALKKLKDLTDQWERSQNYLYSKYREPSIHKTIDSLFAAIEPYSTKIIASSRAIIRNPEPEVLKSARETIQEAESSFQSTIDLIINTYEKDANRELERLINTLWVLASIIILGFFGQAVFVIIPVFKELLQKNHELSYFNEELSLSENSLKKNMLELRRLKLDLEIKETYNKIFIEQSPTAIAMLDNDMCYLAVSQRWITDYKMEGKEIIGKSHYELFPEIEEAWKDNHQKCLNGFIDTCEEAPFKRADGSVQWIFWDVRPWYISEGNIGGLLMHTGDITRIKEDEREKERIEKILSNTNKIARIGTWELNIETGEYTLSKITCEILKLPEDFKAFQKDSMHFYKEGASRDKIIKSTTDLIELGIPFDIELEMITQEGNSVWVRKIGQVEYVEGKCTRIYGIFQDISEIKKSENELLKKNQLLSFAEDITMMGHWQWDTVADKVVWSNNLYKMFELDKGTTDLKFDSYFNFVHPDDKEIVIEHFDKAANEKRFYSFTHRIITTTGVVKTIQLLGEVFTNERGEIIEMIGTVQDITEQKMAENKFRGLLESAPDAMVIVNESGTIDLINKQAEKLFGYTTKELIGNPIEILIPKRFVSNHTTYRDEFFAKPKTRAMGEGKDLFGINKKGEEIPIQISLGPLNTEEGLLVSVAIRDITNQKLAERKILSAKENLEVFSKKLISQNTQLEDFTHITSHNLRAPVSNLNSLLDIYKISESEEEKVELFEKFEIVIQHLTLTLNTLIEALKTKNETEKRLEEISFKKILNKTKEILSGEILKSGAVITSNFNNISSINYNKIYLESIFLNLVGNAIKYKAEDRVLELFIESEIIDGKIKLSFKDNGLGIDLERHGHKLFGLNKVFHRHPDAKGVGLFMTKTQIEAMGGTISASSIVNEGTTFIISFN